MGNVYQVGNEFIREERLNDISDSVLEILKKEKQSYQINKTILKHCIDRLEKEVNSTIFR